jgi:hypothetical protein
MKRLAPEEPASLYVQWEEQWLNSVRGTIGLLRQVGRGGCTDYTSSPGYDAQWFW